MSGKGLTKVDCDEIGLLSLLVFGLFHRLQGSLALSEFEVLRSSNLGFGLVLGDKFWNARLRLSMFD